MPKMMIIDTYYQEVLDAIAPTLGRAYDEVDLTYDEALAETMSWQFGTSDFYSRHLREFGWQVEDVIINSPALQSLWAQEHGLGFDSNVIDHQIEAFQPDVLFLQNLTCLGSRLQDNNWKSRFFIAGQCSCAVRREVIPDFRVIFTSFPHYVQRFNRHMWANGGKMVFNALSFEPECINHSASQEAPKYDIVFIGGVGNPGHWSYGLKVLNAIALAFPDQFKWWGYGYETLPIEYGTLRQCHQGSAWGRRMYEIFCSSKIVVNRHGEISSNFANNMRMYEATGCGALLLTEAKSNLRELFDAHEVVGYNSPNEAVERIRYFLENPYQLGIMAQAGQQRTLQDHTYRERMKVVSDTILEML
jgi:hypothetical protein